MEGPQLRQSAQQAAEPLRAPSRSSARGPAHPGQQVQDHLLQFLHAANRLQGCSVCRAETGIEFKAETTNEKRRRGELNSDWLRDLSRAGQWQRGACTRSPSPAALPCSGRS